jgi:hypothetical protein
VFSSQLRWVLLALQPSVVSVALLVHVIHMPLIMSIALAIVTSGVHLVVVLSSASALRASRWVTMSSASTVILASGVLKHPNYIDGRGLEKFVGTHQSAMQVSTLPSPSVVLLSSAKMAYFPSTSAVDHN